MSSFWKLVKIDFATQADSSFTATYRQSVLLVQLLYLFATVQGLLSFHLVSRALSHGFAGKNPVLPVHFFPVAWLPTLMVVSGIGAIVLPLMVVFVSRSRLLRFATFFTHWLFWALRYTAHEKIYHGHNTTLLVLALLVLLPREEKPIGIRTQAEHLRIFWACQAMVLLTYTCAGVSKLLGLFYDLRSGGPSLLDTDILALHIAQQWQQAEHTLFGEWLVLYPSMSQALFVSVIVLELIAFPAAFVPAAHLPIGLALVAMHWGIANGIGISFSDAQCLLIPLLVMSPFGQRKVLRVFE